MTMIEAVVKIKAAGGVRVGGKLNIIYLQRESQIERERFIWHTRTNCNNKGFIFTCALIRLLLSLDKRGIFEVALNAVSLAAPRLVRD